MASEPIVVVGGFMSWPWGYRQLTRSLREVSGRKVYVVPITPLDWVTGAFRGFGQVVFAVARTVDRALLDTGADKVILVGHSAGGITCRVYIGGELPYGGRRYSGHRRVSRLITLGCPHVVAEKKRLSTIAEINNLFPGALHKPEGVEYLSVVGLAVDGSKSRRARKRYERVAHDGQVPGDGVIPVSAALLPGSETVTLDGVYHHRGLGRWYGSDPETVGLWWSEAR
jgi:pimeloyl-ACP methyl ester carboxylesterase